MRLVYAGPVALESLVNNSLELKEACIASPFEAGAAIVECLIASGHHVTAVTFSHKIAKAIHVQGHPLSYVILPFHPHGGRNLFLKNTKSVKAAVLWANPDFVFANWSYEYGLGTIQSKIPHLITIHDAPWLVCRYLRPKYYWIPRMLLSTFVIKRAQHLVCVSPYIQNYLRQTHHRASSVIPNPLPPYLQASVPPPEKQNTGLPVRFVSLLTDAGDRKNPKPMLLGFRDLIRAGINAELDLYGSNLSESSLLYQWAVEHEATKNVNFNGRIAHEQLMNLLKDSADVLVHPSLEESFGLTIAEAMSFGVPVIAGEDSGAVSWVAAKGKAGLFIDVRRPAAFTQAMKTLAESSELRRELGSVGYDYAKEEFNAAKVAASYLALATSELEHQPTQPTPWD